MDKTPDKVIERHGRLLVPEKHDKVVPLTRRRSEMAKLVSHALDLGWSGRNEYGIWIFGRDERWVSVNSYQGRATSAFVSEGGYGRTLRIDELVAALEGERCVCRADIAFQDPRFEPSTECPFAHEYERTQFQHQKDLEATECPLCGPLRIIDGECFTCGWRAP